jgi:hypothetical protein
MKGQSRLFVCAFALAAALLSASAVSSCSAVPANQRIGIDAPSGSEAQFGPVGDYLANRCGTLDCHGSMSRNFRVYGCEGMRLDPKTLPGCSSILVPGQPPMINTTTPAEHAATYRSLVGLEPTVMSEVYDNQGEHPELLTFVRKARGLEAHKGGAIITPGDVQDICITSWLARNTNATACGQATGYPMMPQQDAAVE